MNKQDISIVSSCLVKKVAHIQFTRLDYMSFLFNIMPMQKCQALCFYFAAGAVCVWVQDKLRYCHPGQGPEESALPRKCSSREEPCTQPATGFPQFAGPVDMRRCSTSYYFTELPFLCSTLNYLLYISAYFTHVWLIQCNSLFWLIYVIIQNIQ